MGDFLDQAKATYDLARTALDVGDIEGAVRSLCESAKLYPHFKTLELLGESLLTLGRANEAIVPLAAATTLNKQGRAPSLLAKALLAAGENAKAHEMAQLALERAPGNKMASEVLSATESERLREQGHQ